MTSITNKIDTKINFVKFIKPSFISEYVIKIGLVLVASEQENRLRMFIINLIQCSDFTYFIFENICLQTLKKEFKKVIITIKPKF